MGYKRSGLMQRAAVRRSVLLAKSAVDEAENASGEDVRGTAPEQVPLQIAADAGDLAGAGVRMSYVKFKTLQQRRRVSIDSFKGDDLHAATSAQDASRQGMRRAWMQEYRRSVFRQAAIQQKRPKGGGWSAAVPKVRPVHTMALQRRGRLSFSQMVTDALRGIRATVSGAIHRALPPFFLFLAGSGAVVVLVLFLGPVAALIGSPMGILFAGETAVPGAVSIRDVIQQLDAELDAAIQSEVAAHPECSQVSILYDGVVSHDRQKHWPEVLAVYAVSMDLDAVGDVATMDDTRKNCLRDIFWQMHQLDSRVDTVEVPSETEVKQYVCTLRISVACKSADDMAAILRFSDAQTQMMGYLLREEMRPGLFTLCRVEDLV